MPSLWLVDGSHAIFRAYHALPHLSTRQGIPTNAVYGFTTMLDSTLATSHSVTLTGLTNNTTYHFRVKSRDNAGRLAISPDNSFLN